MSLLKSFDMSLLISLLPFLHHCHFHYYSTVLTPSPSLYLLSSFPNQSLSSTPSYLFIFFSSLISSSLCFSLSHFSSTFILFEITLRFSAHILTFVFPLFKSSLASAYLLFPSLFPYCIFSYCYFFLAPLLPAPSFLSLYCHIFLLLFSPSLLLFFIPQFRSLSLARSLSLSYFQPPSLNQPKQLQRRKQRRRRRLTKRRRKRKKKLLPQLVNNPHYLLLSYVFLTYTITSLSSILFSLFHLLSCRSVTCMQQHQ